MKLSKPMMKALVRLSTHGHVHPASLHRLTLNALKKRGLAESFIPEQVNGQPAMFPGVHPDRVRLTDRGRRFAVLGRLGVKNTTMRRST